MQHLLSKEEFDLWLVKFNTENEKLESSAPAAPALLLGQAFSQYFLQHDNPQLSKLQCEEEAIRYILHHYVDYAALIKVEVA